jgi:peptidoglycan/LPS O-acetylase OafA/YrhL
MTETSPRGAAPRLILLDGLRGIAAIGTVFFHINMDGSAPAFARGYLFVDFFFLLSGFVLALAFEPRFASGLDWRGFLSMRFARFWPLVALGTAIGASAALIAGMNSLALVIAVASGLAMVPIPARGMLYPLNAPQWSLFFELLMNLFHGAIFWRLRRAALWGATVVLAALTVAAIGWIGDADHGSNGPEFAFAAVRTGFSYCLGIALARLWAGRSAAWRIDWRVALLAPPLWVVMLALVPHPAWAGDALTIVVVLPVLFCLAARAEPPQWAQPALKALGALSFPLYALHFPLITLWMRFAGPEFSRLGALPFVLVVSAAAAWLLPASGFRLGSRPRIAAA